MSKALFLDRDGTLIRYKPYLHKVEEVEVLPGVTEALALALKSGYELFLLTNQSGVGRGYFSMDDVHAVNACMISQIGLGKAVFKEICIAPEAPETSSVYRKPSPRFINEMIKAHHLNSQDCFMIGDSISDMKCGINANINSEAIISELTNNLSLTFFLTNYIPVHRSLLAAIKCIAKGDSIRGEKAASLDTQSPHIPTPPRPI